MLTVVVVHIVYRGVVGQQELSFQSFVKATIQWIAQTLFRTSGSKQRLVEVHSRERHYQLLTADRRQDKRKAIKYFFFLSYLSKCSEGHGILRTIVLLIPRTR